MRNTTRAIAAAVIVATAPRLLLAADAPAPAPPAVPALSDLLTGWGLTVSGDIAASYYHSNGYPGATGYRAFDQDHDSFQLDEAGLQIGYQPKAGIGGYVDVIAGTDAKVVNGAEGNGDGYFEVRQAYLQYATGPLTVIAGKFVTLAGAEVINPSQNTNFSRSLLFQELEPLTHTGVRATYAVTDTVNVIAGINNGWNWTAGSSSSAEGSKTGEFGVTFAPNKMLSLGTYGYIGKVADKTDLSLIDFVGTVNITSALTVILNADFWQEDGEHINGFALYGNYGISDAWRVSVRGEYLNFLGSGHVIEGTATVGYSPVKNFEVRAELRYDKAQEGDKIFVRAVNNAEESETFANNNLEFALQGVYKFSLP